MTPWILTILLMLGEPPEETRPPELTARSEQARESYARGDFSHAASLFDELWASDRNPDNLYNAGFAHEAAGNDILALVRFTHFAHLEGVEGADREEVRARIERLRAALTPVALAVTPGSLSACARVEVSSLEGDDTTGFALSWLTAPGDDETRDPTLESPTLVDGERSCADRSTGATRAGVKDEALHVLHLPPGRWQVRLALPNSESSLFRASAEHELEVGANSAPSLSAPLRFKFERHTSTIRFVSINNDRPIRRSVDIRLEDGLGLHPPILRTTREDALELDLPSGPWRVVIATHNRGRDVVTHGLEISADELRTVNVAALRLSAPPRDNSRSMTDTPRTRRILVGSLAGAGVLLTGAGAPLVALSARTIDDKRAPGVGLDETVGPDIRNLSAGAGLVGAGLGSGVATVSALFDVKPRVWLIEAGIGGALLTGGTVVHALSLKALKAEHGPNASADSPIPEAWVDAHTPGLVASAALLGAGVGLALGAGAGLLEQRLRRPRTNAALLPAPAGLAVRF